MTREEVHYRLLKTINGVVPVEEYLGTDFIFSQKYNISSIDMVYILLRLSKEFQFEIDDAFVDQLEFCTFDRLEELLLENNASCKSF